MPLKVGNMEKILLFFKNVKIILINFIRWIENKMEHICSTVFYLLTFYLIVFSIYFGINTINNLYEIIKNLFLDNDQLMKLDLLSTNCLINENLTESFNNKNIENFTTNSNVTFDLNTNEELKTVNGIPVKYYNKYLKKYLNLNVSDFYWKSSYKTYLTSSSSHGRPSLDAIKIALQQFKVRTINLDVYSNSETVGDPDAVPIVRSEKLYYNFEPLDFYKCLETIKKYAWVDNKDLPLVLYLNLNFADDNIIYEKIYYAIMKNFSNNLLDKKYSFSGRGGIFPAGQINMIDALGKIIIITNKYPSQTLLDEIINGNTSGNSSFVTIDEYTEDQKQFGGLSMKKSKNELINKYKTNIEFVYSQNKNSSNSIFNAKTGLSNPNFIDCCNYGLQFVMMSLYLPDDYLKIWFNYFKNKNSSIVLKYESLRFIPQSSSEVQQQNPLLGYKTKQFNIPVDGFFTTHKSGIKI